MNQVKTVNIQKVEDKFEAYITFDNGENVSKVLDDFEEANEWVSDQSSENEPTEPVIQEEERTESEQDAEGTQGETNS